MISSLTKLPLIFKLVWKAVQRDGYTEEDLIRVLEDPAVQQAVQAYKDDGHTKEEAIRFMFEQYMPPRLA
jgi:hypothetical protein